MHKLLTTFLLCLACSGYTGEKLFILAESGFVELLKDKVRELAQTPDCPWDCKLASSAEPGEIPVLRISKDAPSPQEDGVLFAMDGLLFYTNAENPVTSLTLEQTAQLVQGELRFWPGLSVPIRQICCPETVPGQDFRKKRDPESPAVIRTASAGLALDLVCEDLTAAAILPLTDAGTHREKVKLLAVGQVMPSPKTILDGTYPVSGRYYLAIRKDAPKEMRAVFEFCKTPTFKYKLRKAGKVPAMKGNIK